MPAVPSAETLTGFAPITHGGDEPVQEAVVIGRGRTATGATFIARLLPAPSPAPGGCMLNVAILGSEGSRASSCFSRTQTRADASVHCDAGQLTIQAFMRTATRRVQLLLSDGRRLTSPALLIPAELGGPAGLYYQLVRGPSPIPVSLTELDAQGHTLRIDRLPALTGCTRPAPQVLPSARARVAGANAGAAARS